MEGTARTEEVAPRGRRLLARFLGVTTVVGLVVGLVFTFLDASTGTDDASEPLTSLMFVVAFGAFPLIGYLLAVRRPGNAIGWLMFGLGVYFGVGATVSSVGWYLFHTGRRDAGLVLLAIDSPSWVPIVVLPVTFLLLLFPDGHLPSPRWRWFAWVLGVSLTLIFLAILLDPAPIEGSPAPGTPNPLGVQGLGPILAGAEALILAIPVGVLGSLLSLVLRYRRSSVVERLQIRWLMTAAVFVAVFFSGAIVASLGSTWEGTGQPGWLSVVQALVIPSFALIPLAIGVSILRYRLFDLDLVINRALLFGALAIPITLVYVAIVGIGAVVGARSSPFVAAAAAAVIALAFQPLRRRAQRLANRLVYGKRASPYEVLSEFAERVGQVYASDELLPRMARALGEGTGAVRADVWVRSGDQLRGEASWPEGADVPEPRALGREPETTTTSMFEPVRHRGEVLGALSIAKRPGDALRGAERRLVTDLASQAGLVLRNAALTEDLLATIEELRRSRQRLVAAQDEERRRLERNLHDGAQQRIVALSVQLGLLERLVERDPTTAKDVASRLQADATEALEELRDLARGIYPPLLADRGLVAALASQARKSSVPVSIESDGVGRYAREAEAAVYFSCLEALQNVAKYASASRVTIRLSDGEGRLRFDVTDDGSGFDTTRSSYGTGLQGIADRLSALGGELEVRSAPGAGTTLTGMLPVERVGA